jgi:hypothetical protein
MFVRSPETTAAGIASALGFVTFLAGVIFKNSEAVTVGLGIIGAAASALGFLSRSESQHSRDKDQGKT